MDSSRTEPRKRETRALNSTDSTPAASFGDNLKRKGRALGTLISNLIYLSKKRMFFSFLYLLDQVMDPNFGLIYCNSGQLGPFG